MTDYDFFEQHIADVFYKVNKYLNIICNELEKKDSFLLNYSSLIDYLSQGIITKLKDSVDYRLYDKKSNLTFMDVYNLARDIIESINPKYLRDYDKILDNGILNFDYENNQNPSSFTYDYDTNKMSININRSFSYRDVITLIHEYFHYTNYSENNSINQNILTEFISIYFETYTINYLRGIGISDEDINSYDRLDDLIKNYELFKPYSEIITIFNNYGGVDKYCIDKYCERNENANFNFVIQKSVVLSFVLEVIEHNYYESECKDFSLEENLSEMFKDNYKYIIGIIFTFYAIDSVDKESIVLLNDNINTKELGDMDTAELLNMIGININDGSFIDKVVESIRKFVKSSEKQR